MNLFDSANYPTSEPLRLVAGDRAVWKRDDLGADYDPAIYDLKYSARLESDGTTEIEITATADGTDFVIEVASSVTVSYAAGRYHWQAYIVRKSDSERITVDTGTWEVLADRDSATTDPRTHARIVLDAVEAVLEGRASKDQEEYSIAGRSLKRTPIPELLTLRDRYRAEVRSEESAERAARGLPSRNTMYVRFKRNG